MSALGWAAYAVVAFPAAVYLLAWVEGMAPREFNAAMRESVRRRRTPPLGRPEPVVTLRWRSRLRRERDDARSAELAARRVAGAAVKAHLAAEHTIATLRAEVASLRRQNLALDAQLDHMTRVNQALDAGITTTTKEN